MQIYLPPEIEHYEPELRLFFDLMVRKLHINRDKGFADDLSVEDMLAMLENEVQELRNSLAEQSQFDVTLECVDVANHGWLLALVVMRLSRAEFNEERPAVKVEKTRKGHIR